MAMTIKGTPILYGEDAERFIEDAERNGKLPSPKLNEEIRNELNDFFRRSAAFRFPWEK